MEMCRLWISSYPAKNSCDAATVRHDIGMARVVWISGFAKHSGENVPDFFSCSCRWCQTCIKQVSTRQDEQVPPLALSQKCNQSLNSRGKSPGLRLELWRFEDGNCYSLQGKPPTARHLGRCFSRSSGGEDHTAETKLWPRPRVFFLGFSGFLVSCLSLSESCIRW